MIDCCCCSDDDILIGRGQIIVVMNKHKYKGIPRREMFLKEDNHSFCCCWVTKNGYPLLK
jgi:hypothetical protein